MSENGEVEVEGGAAYPVLPKDVAQEIGTVKLFNKWTYEDVEVKDISLTYVSPARICDARMGPGRDGQCGELN